jgi:hypothetical protein
MKVLYILERTDLKSMNNGKGSAQSSHASLAAAHDIGSGINGGLHQSWNDWKSQTGQGFGTTIVLAATIENIRNLGASLRSVSMEIAFGEVIDPTYPFFVEDEIFLLLDESIHTADPVNTGKGYACCRKEVTCAYFFGVKEDIEMYVEHLNLLP